MGVPKFYRWISERYPLINQIISNTTLLPEIDNFYLDMNGIIHACTHPNDQDISKSLTQREMMLNLFRYLERMINEIVRPKKILFLAIDGVAPRAKLNQQRSRRFRSAEDRKLSIMKAQAGGEEIDESTMFDSNCITPGTEFMEIVDEHIKWYIRKKIKEDPLWHNLKVYYSGHNVPGEGEHKIMEFIREQQSLPDYQPNQHHCMYGQDADLIMLGLASHEPHFVLLREVINFQTFKRTKNNIREVVLRQTKEVQFQLLHIYALRQYLEVDIGMNDLNAIIDMERVIDDFIFLTFLVGNDFLPHLPTLDISEHAFDIIFNAYKEVLYDTTTEHPNYLTYRGDITSYTLLQRIFEIIGQQEQEILAKREVEMKKFMKKISRQQPMDLFQPTNPILTDEEQEELEFAKQLAFEQAIAEAMGKADVSSSSEGEGTGTTTAATVREGKDYRGRYYFEKFQIIAPPSSVMRVAVTTTSTSATASSTISVGVEVVESPAYGMLGHVLKSYLEGLLWCLAYYMKGCVSWTWYYPYHYGPMLQDMVSLQAIANTIQFNLGKPFNPFQQLLGCLPPLSKSLLPASYQWLMTAPNSPVLQYYPLEFELDANGKKNPWEMVVLLPFIDETKLKEAERQYCPSEALAEKERRRNTFGDICLFEYDPKNVISYPSPYPTLATIQSCHSTCHSVHYTEGVNKTYKIAIGTDTSSQAGFPNIQAVNICNIDHKFSKINIFGSMSKYRNVSFVIAPSAATFDITGHSHEIVGLLGKHCYVNYPTLHEAKVHAISTRAGEYRLISTATLGKIRRSLKLDDSVTFLTRYSTQFLSQLNQELPSSSPLGKLFGKGLNVTILPTSGSSDSGSEEGYSVCYFSHDHHTQQEWQQSASQEKQLYATGRSYPGSAGIILSDDITVRFKVHVLQGMHVNVATGQRMKVFGQSEADVPLQLISWVTYAVDQRYIETSELPALEKYIPIASKVVGLAGKYKGILGEVHGHTSDHRLEVTWLSTPETVNRLNVTQSYAIAVSSQSSQRYYNSGYFCKIIGVSPSVLGMLVSTLLVETRVNGSFTKVDVGLNLKKNAQYQLLDYVRYSAVDDKSYSVWQTQDNVKVVGSEDHVIGDAAPATSGAANGANQGKQYIWEYSEKALTLIQSYRQAFPELFDALRNLPSDKTYSANEIFRQQLPEGTTPEMRLKEISEWLKQVDIFNAPRTPLSTVALSKSAIHQLEEYGAQYKKGMNKKTVLETMSLTEIIKEDAFSTTDLFNNFNHCNPQLGDRVVSLHNSTAPFGLLGTIVVIHNATQYVEVIFDEEFTAGTTLSGYCSPYRGRLCPWNTLLRVSSDSDYKLAKSAVRTVSPKPQKSYTSNIAVSPILVKTKPPAAAPVANEVSQKKEVGTGGTAKVDELKTAALLKKLSIASESSHTETVTTTTTTAATAVKAEKPSKKTAKTNAWGSAAQVMAKSDEKEKDWDPSVTPKVFGSIRIHKKAATPVEGKTEATVAPVTVDAVIKADLEQQPVSEAPVVTTAPIVDSKSRLLPLDEDGAIEYKKSNGTGLQALLAAVGSENLLQSSQQPRNDTFIPPPSVVGYIPQVFPPMPPTTGFVNLPGQYLPQQPSPATTRAQSRPNNRSTSRSQKRQSAVDQQATNLNEVVEAVNAAVLSASSNLVPPKVILKRNKQ